MHTHLERSWGILSTALLLLAATGCQEPPAEGPTTAAGQQESADPNASGGDNGRAEVSLVTLDCAQLGDLIDGHNGKVVVADVWSTSCGPCLREFHNLVALHQQYGDQIACVSVNVDYTGGVGTSPEDARPQVLKFLQDQGATFENVLCSEETDVVFKKLGIFAIPAVLVYDQQGELVAKCRETSKLPPIYEQVREQLAERL